MRGGGGKGMRIAMTREEFDAQLDSAKVEDYPFSIIYVAPKILS